MRVMLDVIAVVARQQVVRSSIVARRLARMLEVPLHLAEEHAAKPSGRPHEESLMTTRRHDCPDCDDDDDLRGHSRAPTKAPRTIGVVREMTIAPQSPWNAEQ